MAKFSAGIGLRKEHYDRLLNGGVPAEISFFEIISENYMASEGRPMETVEALRRERPVALHGVSLSIGSSDRLAKDYLRKLGALRKRLQAFSVSDHLCWTGMGGHNTHDLLPLPYTEATLRHVVARVKETQDALGTVIALENPSAYVAFARSNLKETEFLKELVRETGCKLLLDLNNVYVNSENFGFDPLAYLREFPLAAVEQIHLAGHTRMSGYLFDTHSTSVCNEVWALYRAYLEAGGRAPVLIEWDDQVPELERVVQEVQQAKVIWDECVSRHAPLSLGGH